MFEVIKELGGDDVEGLKDVKYEERGPAQDENDDNKHHHGDDPGHVGLV